jgi:hypothetical protein
VRVSSYSDDANSPAGSNKPTGLLDAVEHLEAGMAKNSEQGKKFY